MPRFSAMRDGRAHLLTDKLQKEAAAAFTAAELRLPKIADPAASESRAAAAPARAGPVQPVARPPPARRRYGPSEPAAAGRCAGFRLFRVRSATVRPGRRGAFSTRVARRGPRMRLLVKWTCRDAEINNLKAVAARHDDKVVEDDAVELVLSSGATGETWHFALNSKGIQQDWRIRPSESRRTCGIPRGGRRPGWPRTEWEAETAIPFASLGQTPNSNRNLAGQLRAAQRRAAGTSPPPYSPNANRPCSCSIPPPAPTARSSGGQGAWTARASAMPRSSRSSPSSVGKSTSLPARSSSALPRGVRRLLVPPSPWAEQGPRRLLAEASGSRGQKRGGGGFCLVLGNIPLDEYFQDPSLKVKSVQCGKVPSPGGPRR